MKRLLVLAPAPSISASTRFRLELFFPALRDAGIEPVLRPFLDEAGFRALYRTGAPWAKVRAAMTAVAGRLGDLVRAHSADAVLVHREAALIGPPLWELAAARGLRIPLVFDFDDAIWVPYESPTYGALLSRLLKSPSKTAQTVKAARVVLVGNEYLATWARQRNARVEIFPTVVDTSEFVPRQRESPVPVLGWIGTHSTVQYLHSILPALERLATRREFIVRVIGGTLEGNVPIEVRPWSLQNEVADFQSLDIGLYPLVEDAWSLGKSGFKAVQYMACGIPVVASPVGVTRQMVRHGENGYLASSEDDWVTHLERLIDDHTMRRQMGHRGREQAVAHWSLQAHADRWVDVVRSAMDAR